MLKTLSRILEQTGNFDIVGSATNGSQALRCAAMLSPQLVLMDAHMPRLNGIQVTRYIKQLEHPPVVIIVTSDDSPGTKAIAEDAGADAFVIKQTDLRHRLIIALQRLFGADSATRAKITNPAIETGSPAKKTSKSILCSP
jgi:CheY-like chemotaxis protein